MTATHSVAAHRLTAILTTIEEEVTPLVTGRQRGRIAALLDMARREAAELTGAPAVAARVVVRSEPAADMGANVVPFRRR